MVIVILLAAAFLYYAKNIAVTHRLSPQSRNVTAIAGSDSFHHFLEYHHKAWPPGYSFLLFISKKLNVPFPVVNLLLFLSTLLLIAVLASKYIPGVPMAYPLLLYAAAAFNYYNMRQFTSEHLMIPLSLAGFYCMVRYIKERNLANLLILSVAVGLLFPVRYFAVVWIFPIIAYKIVCHPGGTVKDRVNHFIIFCFTSLYLVSIWMFHMYIVHESITGAHRFAKPKTLTGFGTNVFFTLKTLFLDFVSPHTIASHKVVNSPYRFTGIEIAVILLLIIVPAAALVIAVKQYRENRRPSSNHKGNIFSKLKELSFQSVRFMFFEYFITYIIITIAIWTIANNDPLYTRFLYPSYVFLILAAFGFYHWLVNGAGPGKNHSKKHNLYKILFGIFYAAVLLVNIYKTVVVY